jgi:rhodanese-related sulfurtransferase
MAVGHNIKRVLLLFPTIHSILKAKKKWGQMEIIHINDYTLVVPSILAKLIFNKPIIVHCRSLQRNPLNSFRSRKLKRYIML